MNLGTRDLVKLAIRFALETSSGDDLIPAIRQRVSEALKAPVSEVLDLAIRFGISTAPRMDDRQVLAEHITKNIETVLKMHQEMGGAQARQTQSEANRAADEATEAKIISPEDAPFLVRPDVDHAPPEPSPREADPPPSLLVSPKKANPIRVSGARSSRPQWTVEELIPACEVNTDRAEGNDQNLTFDRNIIADHVIRAVKITYSLRGFQSGRDGEFFPVDRTLLIGGGKGEAALPRDIDWADVRKSLEDKARLVFRPRNRTYASRAVANPRALSYDPQKPTGMYDLEVYEHR